MAFDPRYDATGAGMPPRRFILYRRHDATGVSGTGIVATGVVWPDGHAALRWKANDPDGGVVDVRVVIGRRSAAGPRPRRPQQDLLPGRGRREERAQECGSDSGRDVRRGNRPCRAPRPIRPRRSLGVAALTRGAVNALR